MRQFYRFVGGLRLGGPAALTLSLTTVSVPAWAWKCPPPVGDHLPDAPDDTAIAELPRNGAFVVEILEGSLRAITLTGPNGPIDTDLRIVDTAGSVSTVFVTPIGSWNVGETYTVAYEFEEPLPDYYNPYVTSYYGPGEFIIAPPDTQPPGPVKAGAVDSEATDRTSCPLMVSFRVELLTADEPQGALVEIELAGNRALRGSRVFYTMLRSSQWSQSVRVERNACYSNYGGLDPGDRVYYRMRLVDVAGNQGPWSDIARVDIPHLRGHDDDDSKKGCFGSKDGRDTAGAWGLPLLLLARRRRNAQPGARRHM